MLNYETLLSSYDDKLTLLQWLKKVEAALKDASAVDFKVNKKGDATLTFSIVFDDGSELESGEIVLQQGESVASAAIVNGHLILTLTNGDELDAGSLFNGNIDIAGNLRVQGDVWNTGDIDCEGKITGAEIVENMEGYSYTQPQSANEFSIDYAGVCKNGNKITFVISGAFTLSDTSDPNRNLGSFTIPSSIGSLLMPNALNSLYNYQFQLFSANATSVARLGRIFKNSNTQLTFSAYTMNNLTANTPYVFRIECTFLLSDNLAA